MYVMTTMTIDKEAGLENMNAAIEAVGVAIKAKGYVTIFAFSSCFFLNLFK